MARFRPCSIAILCGGSSTRFGNNKCFQTVGGKELYKVIYERVKDLSDDIFLQGYPAGVDTRSLFSGIEIPVNEDLFAKKCAFTGIYSALFNARNPYVFAMGCDMPYFDGNLFGILCSRLPRDIVVPRWRDGFYEPLSAIYSKSLTGRIRASLEKGELRISDLFSDELDIEYVDINPLIESGEISSDSFLNINRPEDLVGLGKGT